MNDFVDRYYVCEDLCVRGALSIQEFTNLDDAVSAYKALDSSKRKALGVRDNSPLPKSLDLIQCHNGTDILIKDYEKFQNWCNPQMLAVVNGLKEKLMPQERTNIRFITPEYDDLFTLPDGGELLLRYRDGETKTVQCKTHPDGYHFSLGQWNTFHICEFAEICRKNGAVYFPAHTSTDECIDMYHIYQVSHSRLCKCGFMSYVYAKGNMKPEDYQRTYSGMLGKRLTLDDIYKIHNSENRPLPSHMRSLSVSDIIVLQKDGKWTAHYVDSIGFQELPDSFTKALEIQQPFSLKSIPER